MTPQPTISQIIRAVSRRYKLHAIALRSRSQVREIVSARQVATYLARRLTSSSSIEIGSALGGYDHSTALHSVGRICEQREQDPEFRAFTDDLVQEILTETAVLHRLNQALPADVDPIALAEDVLAKRRDPVRLSTLETLALAAAVSTLADRLSRFAPLIDRAEEMLAANRLKQRDGDARSHQRFCLAIGALKQALRTLATLNQEETSNVH